MAGLNPSQQAAVEHERGPLLVLAGAGSGKTRVITHRIARIVERGTPPEAILAVSFTNKAAAEMGERMVPLVGKVVAPRLCLSTFHSFGVRFLGEESDFLWAAPGEATSRAPKKGRPARHPFVIFDQGDSLGLVREILHRLRRASGTRKLNPAAILARLSLWKNQFLAPEAVTVTDFEYDDVAHDVYPRYEAALRAMCAVDFDDLVVQPVRILEREPTLAQKWRRRFRHLLIDEFQDTNRAQLALVRHLVGEERNICVVGDDDQAIYGWRGADVGNILDFEAHFPGATVVKLEDNYRSRAPILSIANAAIAAGTARRHLKELRAARGGGDKVRVCVVDQPDDEAKLVAREIGVLREKGARLSDIAVLYRSNLQARLIEEELRAAGFAHRVFGGAQFFDRKEIKDAAAYLRVVVNPTDEISLRRIINYPPRGIGETTVERVEKAARTLRVPFGEALRNLDRIEDVPEAARRAADALFGSLERARGRFRQGPVPGLTALADAARDLYQDVGLRAALDDVAEGGASGAKRWDNVEFLLRSLARYEAKEDRDRPSMAAFLARITLDAPEDTSEEDRKNQVTLSTLHGAKGLEFGTVFLIGCVEGQLPHSRTTDPKASEAAPTDVEEERRLFYVGVTRARDRLYLTRARVRGLRGRSTPMTPSRFLDGLPEADLELFEESKSAPLESEEMAARTRAFLERLSGLGPPTRK